MNKLQPDTPSASTFFDALLFSQDSSQAIPDTLANAIPETMPEIKDTHSTMQALEEQETIALPTLRLPQVLPSKVPRSPVLPAPQTLPPDTLSQLYHMPNAPVTPRPNEFYDSRRGMLTGVTYIPRSMDRHAQPTLVDALIACGTLVLLFFCLLLFLYFVGL